jgi:hypothetical protein
MRETPLPKMEGDKMQTIKSEEKEAKLKRINTEVKRLNGIYKDIDKKSKGLIEGLIKRSAYMKITLEDYEADLDNGGYVEMFSQSEHQDPYERERPVARLYNTMNKNYQSIMKQLADLMPKQQQKPQDDGFDAFVNGRDD